MQGLPARRNNSLPSGSPFFDFRYDATSQQSRPGLACLTAGCVTSSGSAPSASAAVAASLSTFRTRPLKFTSHLAARLMLPPYPIHPIYPDAHAPALMHKGRELLMKLLYRLDWLHRVDPVERDGDLLCVGSVYGPMASAGRYR